METLQVGRIRWSLVHIGKWWIPNEAAMLAARSAPVLINVYLKLLWSRHESCLLQSNNILHNPSIEQLSLIQTFECTAHSHSRKHASKSMSYSQLIWSIISKWTENYSINGTCLYDNISVQLVGRMSRRLYLMAIASVANYGTSHACVIY